MKQHHNRSQYLVLIVFLGIALINGCSVDIELDHEGFPCNENQKCKWGLICIDNVCVMNPCAEIHCDEGFICNEGICEPLCESLKESCTEEGYEECLEDKNGYRICGYFSEEYPECLVWEETGFCEDDEVCIDGACVICGNEGEPCCFNSGCEEGFQCNHETECEAHVCTGPSIEECGNCGRRRRTCEDGVWSEWGDCMGEGACAPDDVQSQECGNNGTQVRTCDMMCRWGEWGECEEEGDCVAGETRNCGNCGTQTCNEEGEWGSCTGEGICTPDDFDTETCGNCGTKTRICASSCEWGEWEECTGEGVCSVGANDFSACGNCGTKTRICALSCEWGEWGECTGEGVCAPGDNQEHDCGNTGIETRTCNSNCEWEDWSLCIGEMVTVSAGAYWMGCNEAMDDECMDGEHPYHEVNVSEFEIDKYQVTLGLYRACVNAGYCTAPSTGSNFCNWNQANREDHPANCINWHQSRAYCEWAGKRLCSESEWEKAARGTDGRVYPWGNQTPTCDYAVFNESGETNGRGCGEERTWPVGSRPLGASPYGVLDMAGNVWEWLEDDWHDNYDGAPTDGSAWVDSPRASGRVLRGGSFGVSAGSLRASRRDDGNPAYHYYLAYFNVGARCCR